MLRCPKADLRLSEVPGRTCLAFWISGCPFKCEDCHSSWLGEDIGTVLSEEYIDFVIRRNEGLFDTVLFMGGDGDIELLKKLISHCKEKGFSVAMYSGGDYDPSLEKILDYYKFGSYDRNKGPITSITSNQVIINCQTGATMNHLFWR